MNKKFDYYVNNILDKKIIKQLKSYSTEKIENNFACSLEFGTAGMRGTMEVGTNNVNNLTVCKLAKSLAEYMLLNCENKSVVICFDTRNNSYAFSRLFAKVLNMYKIKTYLFKNFAPTPLCVYAVKKFGCEFGVMITASHNNKFYNGIKVYDNNGIQINNNTQKAISEIFNNTDEVEIYNKIFKNKLSKDIIFVKKDIEIEFSSFDVEKNEKNLKIVYTPLNGTGKRCVTNLLRNCKYKFHIPACQKMASGDFKTCPYPNPEMEESFCESIKLAKKVDADIIVATDPDSDRLGAMVKHNGNYVKLSGNEVGYIFADYLLSKNKNIDKFVVTTVVTSPLIDDICKKYNATLQKTLTGFMSIGTKKKELQEKFGEDAFCLAYEESCGYVVKSSYCDKDGIYATKLLCEIAQNLKAQSKTLIDYLDDIYGDVGYTCSLSDSVMFNGANSKQKLNETVENLRKNPLKSVCGYKIDKIVDYFYDNTGLPKQNFLEYYAGKLKFILRPSGTEPKFKIYLFLKENKSVALEKAKEVLNEIKELLK